MKKTDKIDDATLVELMTETYTSQICQSDKAYFMVNTNINFGTISYIVLDRTDYGKEVYNGEFLMLAVEAYNTL